MKSPRLIQLLQNEIRPILRKEDGNRDAIHLYSLGAWWVAFESSAFQLACRCPDAVIIPLQWKEIPYPLLAACVALSELPACNARKEQVTLQAPRMDTERYRQWRKKKLKWFLEELRKAKNEELTVS